VKSCRQFGKLAAIALLGSALLAAAPAAAQTTSRMLSATSPGSNGARVESLVMGYPVPGQGFDYTHHTAMNRNVALRALIDPVTQQRLAQAQEILRAAPVALPLIVPAVVNNIQVVIVQAPPVVLLPAAVAEPEREDDRDAGRRSGPVRERTRYIEREPEPAGPAAPSAQPREVPELVLVRKDGGLLFAVGYVLRGDRMVYITREGHRQSLALVQLDLDATRSMNESLGTTLKL
jgi:hypothetical protein